MANACERSIKNNALILLPESIKFGATQPSIKNRTGHESNIVINIKYSEILNSSEVYQSYIITYYFSLSLSFGNNGLGNE